MLTVSAGDTPCRSHGSRRQGNYLGRKPSYSRKQFIMVKHMLARDAVGIARIAKETD